MNLREYAAGMAAYNKWMNDKVYAAAAELTDEQRKQELGAAFGSIHGTLNHLLLADEAWLQRFRGQPVTMKSPSQELYSDFEELSQAREAMDEEIFAWIASLPEEFAEAPFSFFSVTYNQARVIPGWSAVTQFFNHQTHHRGQVSTLLHQLGKDIGVTDFAWQPYLDPK